VHFRGPILFCVLLSAALSAQRQAPESSQPAATIRSNPRIVLLDVVATDASGKPVHGLNEKDFTVIEDVSAQNIRSFEEHIGSASAEGKPIPNLNLGPDVYTNFVPVARDEVTNLVLFDVLNMSSADMVSAKYQLLKLVQKLPPTQQLGLFVLGRRLRMIQGLTRDTKSVYAAARDMGSASSPAYSDMRGLSAQFSELEHSALAKAPPEVLQNLERTLAEEHDIKTVSRAQYTFDGLGELALAMARIPGRKNLIWITSAFPFDPVVEDEGMRKLSSQLAASRIAVYPIDARGVVVNQPDASVYGPEIFSAYGDKAGAWIATMNEEVRASYESMFHMAEQTGGRPFFNQNEFLPAVERIIDIGSNYYSLSYRPENSKWDGRFRKLRVKCARRDVKLVYRTGYYAVADPLIIAKREDRDRALQVAMQPGTPPVTSLIFKARVKPPSEERQPARLDFVVDVADLVTPEDPARKSKKIEVIFVANAMDGAGKVTSRSWTVKSDFNEAQLENIRRTGLRIHQDFPLEAGMQKVRLAVMDENSGKLGTLDVSLNIPAPVK
jgi:VWFA-related protein